VREHPRGTRGGGSFSMQVFVPTDKC
jgi:hypothetical protein